MDTIDQIEKFMKAIIQQESGGDYSSVNPDSGAYGAFQIMPENWESWARDAGLPITAPPTAENQYRVAKNKMIELFNRYGNWKDVARAWYAGEGSISWSQRALDRPQDGYPSVNEYANSVYSIFSKIMGIENTQPKNDDIKTPSFIDSIKKRIQDLLPNEKNIPLPEKTTPTGIFDQIKEFLTKGIKTIGMVLVGLVLMIFGVYILTKDETEKFILNLGEVPRSTHKNSDYTATGGDVGN